MTKNRLSLVQICPRLPYRMFESMVHFQSFFLVSTYKCTLYKHLECFKCSFLLKFYFFSLYVCFNFWKWLFQSLHCLILPLMHISSSEMTFFWGKYGNYYIFSSLTNHSKFNCIDTALWNGVTTWQKWHIVFFSKMPIFGTFCFPYTFFYPNLG